MHTIKRRKLFIPANRFTEFYDLCYLQHTEEGRAGVTLHRVEVPGEEEGIPKAVHSLSSVQQKIWKCRSLLCYLFLAIFIFLVVCKRKCPGIRFLDLV